MPERPATDFLDRLAEIADRHPDRPAFVVAQPDHREQTLTFAGLRADWLELASRLTAYGLGSGDVLVITLRNHIHYLSLIFGAWRAGIAALPISPVLAPADRDALLQVVQAELGRPVVVDTVPHESYDSVVVHADQPISFVPAENSTATTDSDRPDHELGYLYMTSGGSTGRPKIMPFPLRWAGNRSMPYRSAGLRDDDKRQNVGAATRLICGNLYHTGNLAPATHVLLTGSAVITMRDFDAAHTVELLRHHSVYSLALAPGHMMAILTLPDVDRNVFRSLARVTHGAAPCPRWVKLGWIDLVGAERLFEIYYSSELSGAGRPIIVNGTEWLAKPGTVGRGEGIRILDENGEDTAPGVIGEIHAAEEFGRAHDYVGTQRLRRADENGYVSVADLGWLDEDGYLFLVDRMSETIRIDGATVHPGAVEAVIAELPQVADVAVVGLHDERGKPYLHALVQLRSGAIVPQGSADAVIAQCTRHLPSAQVPQQVQFTGELPRTAEGKMRKSVVRSRVLGQPDETESPRT